MNVIPGEETEALHSSQEDTGVEHPIPMASLLHIGYISMESTRHSSLGGAQCLGAQASV